MTNILEQLIAFAQADLSILAITKGYDPMSYDDDNIKVETYYFIAQGKYDAERADGISELDMLLTEKNSNIHLGEWPISVDKINEYTFLGEIIWQR